MKRSILIPSIIALLILLPLFITGVFADPRGPLGPGGDPIGGGGSQAGGPIEDGIGVLIALSVAYGAYTIVGIWRKKGTLNKREVY